MKKRFIFLFLLLVYVFLYSWLIVSEVQFNSHLANGMYIFLPFWAVLGGVLLALHYGLKSAHGKAFLCLTAGVALFLLGELLWVYYSMVGTDPFPSLADIFYLLAYPFFFYGFLKEIQLAEIKLSPKKILLATTIFIVLSAVFFYAVFASIEVSGGIANVIAFLYILGDIVLVLCLVFLAFIIIEYRRGWISICWLWFLGGFIFILAADFVFAIYHASYIDNVYLYAITDSGWLLGYGLIAIGMICFYGMLKNEENKIKQKIKGLIK